VDFEGGGEGLDESGEAEVLEINIVLGDFAKALSLPWVRIGWLFDRDREGRAGLIDAGS
jgi:hypothetical protein